MAQLIKFDPDPEGDGNLGLAHFDDGSSLYTDRTMIPPELMGPDMRLAQAAPNMSLPQNVTDVPTQSSLDEPGGFTPAPPNYGAEQAAKGLGLPNLAGAGGSGGAGAASPPIPAPAPNGGSSVGNTPSSPTPVPAPGSEAAIDAQIAAAKANPIVTNTAPTPPAPQQLPNLGRLDDPRVAQAAAQQQAAAGQHNPMDALAAAYLTQGGGYSSGVNPQAMLRNGVMVPTGERTTSEQGVPYSPAEAQVRELANQKVVEAHINTAEAQSARAEAQRLQAEAVMPALQRQVAENQAKFDTIQANYQRERAQLQFEIDDFDRNAKVDPNRFFAERGAWSQIGAIVGQALGAYAATMSGGPNWAQEAINREIDRDIDAQKATLDQQRIGQRNALAHLADRYGDVDQAAAALKLSQQQIVDKQILAFGAASQRDDIMQAAQEWVAQNQQQRVQEELALYHASIGKQTREEQSRFIQPQAPGNAGLTAAQLGANARNLMDVNKLYEALNRGQGGPPAIRPANPANPLYVPPLGWTGADTGGYARQMGEASEVRTKQADFKNAMSSLDAAEKLLEDKSRLVGVGRAGTHAYAKAGQLQAMLETNVAKAYGGVITDSDRESAVKELPNITATDVTGTEAARLQGAREKLMRVWEAYATSKLTPYEPLPPLRATSKDRQDAGE